MTAQTWARYHAQAPMGATVVVLESEGLPGSLTGITLVGPGRETMLARARNTGALEGIGDAPPDADVFWSWPTEHVKTLIDAARAIDERTAVASSYNRHTAEASIEETEEWRRTAGAPILLYVFADYPERWPEGWGVRQADEEALFYADEPREWRDVKPAGAPPGWWSRGDRPPAPPDDPPPPAATNRAYQNPLPLDARLERISATADQQERQAAVKAWAKDEPAEYGALIDLEGNEGAAARLNVTAGFISRVNAAAGGKRTRVFTLAQRMSARVDAAITQMYRERDQDLMAMIYDAEGGIHERIPFADLATEFTNLRAKIEAALHEEAPLSEQEAEYVGRENRVKYLISMTRNWVRDGGAREEAKND